VIVIVHALLESSNKRVAMNEPEVTTELMLYLALLIVLLAARIPTVRSALANLRYRRVTGEASNS
jgi:hypothetical protein